MKKISLAQISITKMKKSDIDSIKNIDESQNINIMSRITIENGLSNKRNKYYVAKFEDKIIAYIAAFFSIDFIDILALVVEEDYKRNKIGSSLLKTIIDQSIEEKIKNIFLEVRKSNIPAQKLYENLGFIKISERKKYYPDNQEDAYIYLRKHQPLL